MWAGILLRAWSEQKGLTVKLSEAQVTPKHGGPFVHLFLVGKTPASMTWVSKSRFEQLHIGGGTAKKPPEARLKKPGQSIQILRLTTWDGIKGVHSSEFYSDRTNKFQR